jgi:putative transposon-encoded protein
MFPTMADRPVVMMVVGPTVVYRYPILVPTLYPVLDRSNILPRHWIISNEDMMNVQPIGNGIMIIVPTDPVGVVVVVVVTTTIIPIMDVVVMEVVATIATPTTIIIIREDVEINTIAVIATAITTTTTVVTGHDTVVPTIIVMIRGGNSIGITVQRYYRD